MLAPRTCSPAVEDWHEGADRANVAAPHQRAAAGRVFCTMGSKLLGSGFLDHVVRHDDSAPTRHWPVLRLFGASMMTAAGRGFHAADCVYFNFDLVAHAQDERARVLHSPLNVWHDEG
jgi:hypothetical protein